MLKSGRISWELEIRQPHGLIDHLIHADVRRRFQSLGPEANHLEIEAMELLRYVYDRGRVGVILVGTLRLYEVFTDGSRPASELEQLWSRVGICELLPGLTEYEGRQMISHRTTAPPYPGCYSPAGTFNLTNGMGVRKRVQQRWVCALSA